MEQLSFKSLNELTTFLSLQEKRISDLEAYNRLLEKRLFQYDTRPQVAAIVEQSIPRSSIFSHSFLARAFAIWGHYFVAQLLIGLAISAVYAIIFILLLGGFN